MSGGKNHQEIILFTVKNLWIIFDFEVELLLFQAVIPAGVRSHREHIALALMNGAVKEVRDTRKTAKGDIKN